jgi:hypothetical protein
MAEGVQRFWTPYAEQWRGGGRFRRMKRAGLVAGGSRLFAVVLDVKFGGFGGVVSSVLMMAVCEMRVMASEMMIRSFMVLCGLAMMTRGVVVMFCCFVVMLGGLLGHESSLRILPGRSLHRLNCCSYALMKVRLQLTVAGCAWRDLENRIWSLARR